MKDTRREEGVRQPGGTGRANAITEGVIWKQLLLFFFPILFGTFFQQLYNTADAVVVGRFVGKRWRRSAEAHRCLRTCWLAFL